MIAILSVYILVHIMTATVAGVNTASALKTQAQKQAQLLSQTYSNHLDATIRQYMNTAQNLSSAALTAIHIETILREYKKLYPQFSHIFYSQIDGTIIDAVPYRQEWTEVNLKGFPAWQKAAVQMAPEISSSGEYWGEQSVIFFSPVILSNVQHQEPSMVGMIAMVLPLQNLFKTISSVQIGDSGSLFVLDQKGKFLFHEDPLFIMSKGLETFVSIEPLDDISASMINLDTGFSSYSDSESRKYISFSPIVSSSWSLGVQGSYFEITREVRRITVTNLLVLLIGIIIGSIIMYYVVHSVVRPIETLTGMTRKIQDGDSSVCTDIQSSSEVGILSRSINSMVRELHNTKEQLEQTVELRTMELKRSNEELEETVAELNSANFTLQHTRNNLENIVTERTVQLRKALNYIDNIINSMPSILIGINTEGIITQWNLSAEQFTGLSKDNALGQELLHAIPQLADEIDSIQNALLTRTPYFETKKARLVQKKTLYDEITVYPLIANGADGVDGAVIRMDDVTDRVIMEESLRQSQKLDAIGQLAGGVAHDFNNMLAGILGSTELLKMSLNDKEKSLEYLKMIIDSAKHAADLTKKLLLFSRKSSKDSVVFDLHMAIEGSIDLLQHSLDKKTRIHSSLQADSVTVRGDFVQLQSALLNLGINADHAMPQGGDLYFSSENIELSEDFCRSSAFEIQAGTFIKIDVRDTGTGIDQYDMERIFEPFFTTKRLGDGTGLGLSVVYGAIQQHSGAVSVESELEKGTVFTMFLPVCTEILENQVSEIKAIRGKGCILVIDDEPIIRNISKATLENLGYSVLIAKDGLQGIDVYKQNQEEIDLVLMDMIMPRMNGKECFKNLKAYDPDIKVIIASGYANVEAEELNTMGFAGFLSKPYDRATLSEMLAKVLPN
jgi:PAS domain S-box-containing protein